MPDLTEPDRVVLAAVFARTNYGHSMPSAHELRSYRTAAKHGTSLKAMVNLVCADLIEGDSDYDMFLEEAESWKETFTVDYFDTDEVFETWPNKQAVWLESEAPLS